MDQSTSVGQLRKQGNERASLRDNRNLIVRPPEGISTQGLQKNSNPGAFQIGRRSINQPQVRVAELQIPEFASPSNEQNIQMVVTLPTKLENPGRKMDKLADENDSTFEAMDQMLSDLLTTQQELEEKKVEIKVWRQKVHKLSSELEEKRIESEKTEKVFIEREKQGMLKKEREIFDLKQKVDRLSAELDGEENRSEIETEVLDLRQKVGTLTAQLIMKEEQLKKQDLALVEQESCWQIKLQALKEKLEAYLKEQHDRSQAEIAQHQLQTKEAEAQLQVIKAEKLSLDHQAESRALSQVEAEKSKADQYLRELQEVRASHAAYIKSQVEILETSKNKESQAHQQLQVRHDTELEQLRRLSDFFRNNSERLSLTAKKMAATIRTLQDSVKTRDREMDDQKSLILSLRHQMNPQNRFYQ